MLHSPSSKWDRDRPLTLPLPRKTGERTGGEGGFRKEVVCSNMVAVLICQTKGDIDGQPGRFF